jgi:hypothetical protein
MDPDFLCLASHHELVGLRQFFWRLPTILRVDFARTSVHHLMDRKRPSLSHVQSGHHHGSCLGPWMVSPHCCCWHCHPAPWHICAQFLAYLLAVPPYPRLLHWSGRWYLLCANHGSLLNIFLYTSWHRYWHYHDWKFIGCCHLSGRGASVVRQNWLRLDHSRSGISQCGLSLDRTCIHEASTTT